MESAEPQLSLENVPCNLCGGNDTVLHYRGRDTRFETTPRMEFEVHRCRRCGLIFLNPRPTGARLGLFYPDSYNVYNQPIEEPEPTGRGGLAGLNDRLWRRIAGMKLREKQRLITQYCPQPGRLLDVGCASGKFLAAMKTVGWDIAGLEMSALAVERARQALGPVVEQGTLETAPWPENSFDVVTLFHVLEHVPDPVGALRRIRWLLRPGGIVVVLVPNGAIWEFRVLGQRDSNPLEIPRHFYHYTPATLCGLASKADLEVLKIKPLAGTLPPA
ncbi:MAG: class I SAM-dependent methyltransferase [Verrucomicrobiae bacterium]|nr:class I SAM-dependent methyltransferase [Verrucomicrobiae bacterium]